MAARPTSAPVVIPTVTAPELSAEELEVMELQQMFSSRGPYPPPRDSTIPKTTLAKLKVGEELLLHADEARQEKEDRRRVREAQLLERLARAQTRREEAKQRQERCRQARDKEHQRKADLVRAIRADEDNWERERQSQQQDLYEHARQRVDTAKGGYGSLDERLDAQEAAVDQTEREQATRDHKELQLAVASMRNMNLSDKRAGAVSSRERRSKALEKAAKQQALLKRLSADEKRAEAKAWILARQQNEDIHLSKAREFKAHVRQARATPRSTSALAPAPGNPALLSAPSRLARRTGHQQIPSAEVACRHRLLSARRAPECCTTVVVTHRALSLSLSLSLLLARSLPRLVASLSAALSHLGTLGWRDPRRSMRRGRTLEGHKRAS